MHHYIITTFCYNRLMQNAHRQFAPLSHISQTITRWLVVCVLVFNAFYCVIPAHTHTTPDHQQPHATQLTHTHEHLADIVAWLCAIAVFLLALSPQLIVASGFWGRRDHLFPPLTPPPQHARPTEPKSTIQSVFPFSPCSKNEDIYHGRYTSSSPP